MNDTNEEAQAQYKQLAGATQVLDHGWIRYIEHMGSDLSIVRRARRSYDAAWRAGKDEKSDEKLINYLIRNGHNTPFECSTATFDVKLPIFVIRQWQRHRTQSYNEASARYTKLSEEYFLPEIHTITEQGSGNKQMRTKEQHPNALHIRNTMEAAQREAFKQYHYLLMLGTPRELARVVLPFGTYTTMSATANLWNWMRFLRERLHEHAQYEIQVYAIQIARELEKLFPVAMKAFKVATEREQLAMELLKKHEEQNHEDNPLPHIDLKPSSSDCVRDKCENKLYRGDGSDSTLCRICGQYVHSVL